MKNWINKEHPQTGQKIIALFPILDSRGQQITWIAGESIYGSDDHCRPMPELALPACHINAVGGWIPFPAVNH